MTPFLPVTIPTMRAATAPADMTPWCWESPDWRALHWPPATLPCHHTHLLRHHYGGGAPHPPRFSPSPGWWSSLTGLLLSLHFTPVTRPTFPSHQLLEEILMHSCHFCFFGNRSKKIFLKIRAKNDKNWSKIIAKNHKNWSKIEAKNHKNDKIRVKNQSKKDKNWSK